MIPGVIDGDEGGMSEEHRVEGLRGKQTRFVYFQVRLRANSHSARKALPMNTRRDTHFIM